MQPMPTAHIARCTALPRAVHPPYSRFRPAIPTLKQVPKQDLKKLAHIRMLMVSIFSKRSKLENLYLQIWEYDATRR